MSRIANNEALIFNEKFHQKPISSERIILIDSTLKRWGNAKVLNFAAALAIAKHPKTDIKCKLLFWNYLF
jgi:hypothetical protein